MKYLSSATSSAGKEVSRCVKRLYIRQKHGLVQAFLGEAIVVVPWFHLFHHRLNVGIGTQLAVVLIITEHGAHVTLGESEHVVELRRLGYVPVDVVSARKVIQRDR